MLNQSTFIINLTLPFVTTRKVTMPWLSVPGCWVSSHQYSLKDSLVSRLRAKSNKWLNGSKTKDGRPN